MKRATQQTASAAALAFGAELSRRGYDVTFTLGNTRRVDLFCSVVDGTQFKVQVKGLSNKDGFYIKGSFFHGKTQGDLFLVVVWVPPIGIDSPFEYYILTHGEAQAEFHKMPQAHKDGRPFDEDGPGLYWRSVRGYQNAWHSFPPARETLSEVGSIDGSTE